MESAYEQMQNQLGQIEAEQLHNSGGGNEKKVFKVVVVGDAGVGKSSIIHRCALTLTTLTLSRASFIGAHGD